jgi:amino acid transporter
LAVIIGGIIGLGILRTPGEVAALVPDPLMFVSLWVLGGLFILLSTLVVAELVGMTPRSGGTYVLVRRAYGPFRGFVIGRVDRLSFSVFFYLFLYVLLIVGVIILRSRQPDTDRPYRARGLPWSTYTCLFGWILIALFQVGVEIDTAAYAAIFVAISWPVYRVLMRSGSNYKIKT